MSDCDVLLFGDYFCDIIITGLEEIPRLGADIFGDSMEVAPGGAYILALRLQQLGVRSRWAARLGTDIFSQFILREAQQSGLDASIFQEYPEPVRQVSLSFSFAHDRGFISFSEPLPQDFPWRSIIATQQPGWVVNTPFDGSQQTRELLEYVHSLGGRVFSDCQYTTARLEDPGMRELLSRTDIFAPNLSEASQLTGESDPQAALASLAEICPLVVLKSGAQGAYARAGEHVWYSPALKVDVMDTTGAGDSFNAGFLAGLIAGEPIETCLKYGNICGGLSTTQCGGTAVPLTMEEVRQRADVLK